MYPYTLQLTAKMTEIIHHRLSVMDSGMIADVFSDDDLEESDNAERLESLEDSANFYEAMIRREGMKPNGSYIPMVMVIHEEHDAEIIADTLEGSTFFANDSLDAKLTPLHGQVIAVANILTLILGHRVVPNFT